MHPAAASLIKSPSTAKPVSTAPDTSHSPSRSPYRFISANAASAAAHPLRTVACSSASRLDDLPSPRSRSSSPCHSMIPHTYPAPPRANLLPIHTRDLAPQRPSLCRDVCAFAKPWLPIGLWVATTVGFLIAIAFWRTEVFQGLDDFAHWLLAQGYTGYTVLFCLIFITTFPPFPMYSTLMALSGYCFGALTGAVISYCASLSGALVVFLLSRAYARDYIGALFARAPGLKRAVRAIEKRPNILFLVRLAPYPYNVMNVLLAASPTLTLRTYTVCTALSLFKVIVHTTIGASIHSFADYHSGKEQPADGSDGDLWTHIWTGVGIALCVGLFVYLAWIARKAVDEELEDDERCAGGEEAVAFLEDMAETPLRGGPDVLGIRVTDSGQADVSKL